MKVSYKWLKDYVDFDLTPEELGERLTAVGIALDGIEDLGKGIENVVVGQIVSLAPHPNADRLQICQINVGNQDGNIQIVTGATNISEGDKIPVALVGAKLPGGHGISRAKLRGVESFGMLCSEEELAIAKEASGIMILPEDAEIGQNIVEFLGMDDVLLDFDLTPNRGDCFSIIGIAREIAAIIGNPIRYPEINVPEVEGDITALTKIEIEALDLCPRYAARIIKNIKIAPSPAWLAKRLQAMGVRSINNVVDVTNYVMLELGQPLHAFDYDQLYENRIVVRRAEQGEKIQTLDGAEKELDENMLVIADGKNPVALAGVMGGAYSEVTDQTTTVLLESAYFEPVSIRRTAHRLAYRTEASQRFGKGIDPSGALRAADRAAQLFAQIGAGEVVKGVIDVYPSPVQAKEISLRPEKINTLLGTDFSAQRMMDILKSLEFKIEQGENTKVIVPTFRPDVTREADLAEEVARIEGYDKIISTLPAGSITKGVLTLSQELEEKAKTILAASGLTEVITYGFINPDAFDKVNFPADCSRRNTVKIKNPLSEDWSVMRTTLIPGVLNVLSYNASHRVTDLRIFEFGKVFISKDSPDKLPYEPRHITGAIMGAVPQFWREKAVEADFFDLKGIVEELLNNLGVSDCAFARGTHPSLHPGRTAEIIVAGEKAGVIGEVHPDVAANYDLPKRAILFEIDFEKLVEKAELSRKYKALPKYPAVERDLAMVISRDVEADKIIESVRAKGGKAVEEVKVFDVYQGSQVPAGFKSIAFSLRFRAEDRTLTDAEVNDLIKAVIDELATKYDAKIRG